MNKGIRRITQLTLTIIMMVSVMLQASVPVCAEGSTGNYYDIESEYHTDLNFSDMEIQWVDEDAVLNYLDQYEQIVESGDADAIIAGYDKLNALMDYTATQYILNDIRHNCDINNDEYAELSDRMLEFDNNVNDRALRLIREALKSEGGDALKAYIDDEDLVDSLLDYEDMTDEEKELALEYQNLTQKYERILISDTHVDIDGEDWNFERLMNDNTMTQEKFYQIAGAIYKARNEQMAPIYIDIVRNRNKEARLDDYDNYADDVYENLYNRDYTTEDVKTIYKEVQEHIVPLYAELSARNVYNYKLNTMNLSAAERIERVDPVIERIHPELRYAWDYMLDHGLYDMDSSPTKMDTGYTIPLYSYGVPFIFDQPFQNWNDVQTVIHEFGHYNEMFHNPMHVLTSVHNVDVSEIDSQALELLCLDYADEIYGKGCGEAVINELLTKMTDAVIEGCIYDEFQYWAYTHEDELTVDTLNEKFCEISNKYGREYEPDSADVYYWPEINHTFEQPMYYISYSTSALASLDILAMSSHDRDAAIDCYMNITTYSGEIPFRETMADVGLPDIFEEGVIEDICIAVSDYAGMGSQLRSIVKLLKDPFFIIAAAVIIIVLVIIIVVRIRTRGERLAKKQRLKQMQMQ